MTRFYKNRFPKIGDVVMTKISEIHPNFAYVQLLEYDNAIGIIVASEVSTKLYKAMSRFLTIGKLQPALVINVDENKGYIDLSKRLISPEEADLCEAKFKQNSQIINISNRIAQLLNVELEWILENWLWQLPYEFHEIFSLFRSLASENIDDNGLKEFTQADIFKHLVDICKFKFKEEPKTVKALVELTSLGGIDVIKEVFRFLKEQIKFEVSIKVISAPLYVIETQTKNAEMTISAIDSCLEQVISYLEDNKPDTKLTINKKAFVCGGEKEMDYEALIKNMYLKESLKSEQFENDEEEKEESD